MADINMTGRLSRDVMTFDNSNGSKTHLINIARPRNYANADGEYGADFVQLKAFTNTEKAHAFYENNMKRGTLVQLTADFRSSSEVKNGEEVFYVDPIIDDINPFLERKSNRQARQQNNQVDASVQQTRQQQPNYNTQQNTQQQNTQQNASATMNNMPYDDPFAGL